MLQYNLLFSVELLQKYVHISARPVQLWWTLLVNLDLDQKTFSTEDMLICHSRKITGYSLTNVSVLSVLVNYDTKPDCAIKWP